MPEQQLKPCIYCDIEPRVLPEYKQVRCDTLTCQLTGGARRLYGETIEEAIDKWNRAMDELNHNDLQKCPLHNVRPVEFGLYTMEGEPEHDPPVSSYRVHCPICYPSWVVHSKTKEGAYEEWNAISKDEIIRCFKDFGQELHFDTPKDAAIAVETLSLHGFVYNIIRYDINPNWIKYKATKLKQPNHAESTN
jgi:hypothetical protein